MDKIKNTKLHQGVKALVIDPNHDKRFGLEDPGSTRWGSKHDQYAKLIKIKSKITDVVNDPTYKNYAQS